MEDFKKFTLLKPTDSVTSDGTKPKETDWPDYLDWGHDRRLTPTGTPVKPTESQDELWEEVAQSIINHVQVMPELKKRFKIERI